MSVVVEADERGRILLPAEIRRKIHTKRFKVTMKQNHVELQPLKSVEELKREIQRHH